jgi:quercetin dioxygenase-like cupin family protein
MNGWNELQETIRERRAISKTTSDKVGQNLTGSSFKESVYRGFCRVGKNPPVEIRPGITRSTLVYNNDNMLCYFHEKPGARVDLHTHYAVQSGYVIKGKVKFFDAEGNERILGPGDGYLFNSNEPHGSVALEETVLVESFTPTRPEYLD